MNDYTQEFKKFFDPEAIQENLKKMTDVEAIQAFSKQYYDVEAIQENFKKAFDMEALQENLKNVYDFESMQDELEKLLDADAAKDFVGNFLNNDVVTNIQEAFENAIDKEAITEVVDKGVKLSSTIVTNNTNAVSDVIVLNATRAREGIDGLVTQVSTLTQAGDLQKAVELQTAYVEGLQAQAKDYADNLSGIVSSVFESNVNLVKEVFSAITPVAPVAKAPAKKPVARKRAPAKKVAKAA